MENNVKFYVEISLKNTMDYIMQSGWFDSELDAVKWAKGIMFLDEDMDIYLMSGVWDAEADIYTDIDFERSLRDEI